MSVNLSRRRFLRSSGVVGGGLVVGVSLTGCGTPEIPFYPLEGAWSPNALIQVTADNLVRFYCPRDEMGQGVTTGLGTLVAEELDVAPGALDVAFAGAHPAYNNPDFGAQATGGSTSIKAHYLPLRQAAANVRAVILDAAAAELGLPRADLRSADGHVLAGDERYPYGRFVAAAAALKLPDEAPMKAASEFRYIGKDFPRLDAVAKATGTAEYGIDVDVPGMHHAVVVRPPVAGGVLKAFDAQVAAGEPGVTHVLEVASGVAVVAPKYWQARQAAAKLAPAIRWELPELATISTAQVKADYAAAMDNTAGDVDGDQGDLNAGFDNAAHTLEGDYWAPYLAHAPMEPMNAVVRIENGEVDVWSGTQGPGIAQGLVARYTGIDKENIRVHNSYLGGAFGRRATLTHVIEATQIAQETGKPIHLLWSREDDIKSGIYRPASLMRLRAGIDESGQISAWQAKRVGGNILPDTLRNMLPGVLPAGFGDSVIDWMVGMADGAFDGWVIEPTSIEGLFEDYDFPNREVQHVTVNHGLPLTFWRSVGHSFTAFAKESMVDELAQVAGTDPVALRLQNSRNNPRLAAVTRIAGERMRQMTVPQGHALGLAAHTSFGSYVAEVAEVSVENGTIRVHNVLCVVDCGQVVNPDVVKAQMEGAIMYGLTAALHGNLDLADGTIAQSNFHDYPILRMNEAPAVEVVMLDSAEAPSGVGEPGLPPIAPAVANAVFAATGQRLRSLPLKLA
jgi:isoquinoline 1-oxidoreductase/isoquinoline 1-oxidoreductase beta subunit